MTLALHVDVPRWRARAESVVGAVADAVADPTGRSGLVPVAKGNGYGLGNARLAAEAARLGVPALAVGTVFEVAEVAAGFPGDLVVLEPFDPRDVAAVHAWSAVVAGPLAPRVVRTLADAEAVAAVVAEARLAKVGDPASAAPRVLLEGLTSMQRFGMDEPTLAGVLADPATHELLRLEGLSLHLPNTQPTAPRRPASAMLRDTTTGVVERGSARTREVVAWALLWTAWLSEHLGPQADEGATTVWVSHLDDAELADLRLDLPDQPVRLRSGTRLWLGDRSLLQAAGTVLAVRRVPDGVGYSQRSGGDDVVVVVSGGTAHGVALAAPASVSGLRSRAVAAGTGALESVGRARSPFTWQDRKLWFVEPPHMHVSQLRLDRGRTAPAVGDALPCEVRFTTLRADVVIGFD